MSEPETTTTDETWTDSPNPVILITPPKMPGAGPDCIFCNAPTQRAGSCWACTVCGSSSSC